MLLRIPSVLDRSELDVVRRMLAGASFVDGKLSAGQVAKRVKHNQEVDRRAHELEQLNNLVMGKLVQHPVYRSGALPLRVAAPYYARYTSGMQYGDHVDDPIMGADGTLYRSDVSITVFLGDPASYDGGELVVNTPFGEQQVKLPAGDAVMYPSSSLHRVAEVTRGERLVAVTWLQSLVRDPARRELLHELNSVRERMLANTPETEDAKLINKTYVNLVRMWGDL
ncbi:MAG TPA: Fe2+-dependent dioxygenase [Acidiferrobacterales bacterium]|nr:Fe2+-dependent dioxygenase [Acidiferrobacterales bacterium]